MDPVLISIAQASTALSVSQSQIKRWVGSGRLTKVYLGRRCVRITTKSMRKLAEGVPA